MCSDGTDAPVLAERLIAVLADAHSCRAYKFWRKTFGYIRDGQDPLYVCGEYETINDAIMMYSLISLRKLDEFLSDKRKNQISDVRYYDCGIRKGEVLMGCEDLLTNDVRNSINRTIAHFTNIGQPSAEDWQKFDHVLEAAEPTLKRLEHAIERLLERGGH